MKKILIALLLVLLPTQFGMAETPYVDYSADYIHKDSFGLCVITQYSKFGKYREDGKDMITIYRSDGMWRVFPKGKMFFKETDAKWDYNYNSYDARDKMQDECHEYSEKLLKKEIINGQPTEKYEGICETTHGFIHRYYVWYATDIKFCWPIKLVSQDTGEVKEYKNIKLGPLPDSLFELPEGFKEIDMKTQAGQKEYMKLMMSGGKVNEKTIDNILKSIPDNE